MSYAVLNVIEDKDYFMEAALLTFNTKRSGYKL